MRDFLDRMRRGERLPRAILTERENEVVMLIAERHSSKEIAATLVISVKTVRLQLGEPFRAVAEPRF